MHRVCCFHWCQCVFSWMVVVWLAFVSLVSCILPLFRWFLERLLSDQSLFSCILLPLHKFRAATCRQQLWIQTHHIWRRLTSIKLQMQSQCSMVKSLSWPVRNSRTLQPPEMAWNMQMLTNNNSINAHRSTLLATNLHSFTWQFPYFLKVFVQMRSNKTGRQVCNTPQHVFQYRQETDHSCASKPRFTPAASEGGDRKA